ncbi:MAG TPA: flagellar hook-associated protein FlgL [Gallionella sp.]|jgi:flagellar hook-associated protein 3 FlgL|nr:flagellar hook-associated protein FlgL [Gallionella sp.]
MRISSNTLFESNVAAMSQQQARLLHTQQQVSTGRRILTASDDPVAAARALDVSQSDAMNTQYAGNRNMARHTLSLAENTLQNVTLLIQDVQTATIYAGNGTLNNSDRQTIATDLSSRLQELISLANSTDGIGNYLFAGYQSRTQPFMDTSAGVSYFGDDGQRLAQVGATQQMSTSDSGADIFMRIKNGNGTFVTQAAAVNTGGGVIGTGSLANPAALTGDNYSILFAGPSAAAVTGNTGDGTISTPTVATQAAVTGNDYSVVFTAANTYDVTNTTTGATLSTGNTYISGQAISFDGLQLNIQDGTTAFIAGDSFTVSSPGYTVTNDTTSAVVLPAPPATGRLPYTSGQAISFDGMRMDIQGIPNAGDQFTVSPSVNESLFTTISNLITALNTPQGSDGSAQLTVSLNRGLNNLGNALDNILTTRSSLGLRLNEVDALQSAGEDLSLQFRQTLSDLQDVDYNKALSDLTMQQMYLEAAQKSFAQISTLSLFNYI